MVKLYFKKLGGTALFMLVLVPFIGAALAFVHRLFFHRYMLSENTRTIIFLIIALLIAAKLLYDRRRKNFQYMYAFLDERSGVSFIKDFWLTLKSKENMVHTLAYVTLKLFPSLASAILRDTALIWLIVGAVRLIVDQGILFALSNTLHWCAVHVYWRSKHRTYERQNAVEPPAI